MANPEHIESTHRSVSRLARSFQQLMREQLSCGPVTVQQCYTLAALTHGPRTMKSLATDVGLHQSTLTRVVEKLERQDLLRRERDENDQRTVRVALTDAGRETHAMLDAESKLLVGALLDTVPADEQRAVVTGLGVLARVLDPHGDAFRDLLCSCCAPRDDRATPGETGRCATGRATPDETGQPATSRAIPDETGSPATGRATPDETGQPATGRATAEASGAGLSARREKSR